MLDQQFEGTITPTAIGYYFQLFNASGDYQNAEVLLDKYFASLSDKTELDSGIRAMYEKNINMFSDIQKEKIREVFAIVDAATLEKVKATTKITEAKLEASLPKETETTVPVIEHTEIAKQSETSNPKQTDSNQKKAVANARTAVDNYLSKSSSKKLKKVKNQDKNEVFKYSQELVLQYVQQHSSDSDYPTMIRKYTETIKTMLSSAFKETPEWLDTVCSLAATLEEDQNAMDKISSRYPFPISNPESCCEQQYYITQRLENSYSDNIWGSIQKELDSYSSKNMSSWIGYNVEYYPLAGAMPGDDATVIVCDQKNPFPESGAYTILCYKTKSTRQLKDSKGFVSESPVVYMISDPDKMYEDYDEYTSIQLRFYELTEKIADAVGSN